jgi:hypothetical protein
VDISLKAGLALNKQDVYLLQVLLMMHVTVRTNNFSTSPSSSNDKISSDLELLVGFKVPKGFVSDHDSI